MQGVTSSCLNKLIVCFILTHVNSAICKIVQFHFKMANKCPYTRTLDLKVLISSANQCEDIKLNMIG